MTNISLGQSGWAFRWIICIKKSDEMTAECILYDDVQQSLKNQGLEEVNYISLSKYFAYVDLENIADYCYVDNKGNVYSRSYSSLSYEDVEASGFEKYLATPIPGPCGSGRRIHCLAPGRKPCSSADM